MFQISTIQAKMEKIWAKKKSKRSEAKSRYLANVNFLQNKGKISKANSEQIWQDCEQKGLGIGQRI